MSYDRDVKEVERAESVAPEIYRAEPCRCGSPHCAHWHVWPVAAVQCVRFTEPQARAVAKLLNEMEARAKP